MRKQVEDICTKIKEYGKESLTEQERKLLVNSQETASICSALAGRKVEQDYIRQLIRSDPRRPKPPRLRPAQTVGEGVRASHWYRVGELLDLTWGTAHKNTRNNEFSDGAKTDVKTS